MRILMLAFVEIDASEAPVIHLKGVCNNLVKDGQELVLLVPRPTTKTYENIEGKLIFVPFFGFGTVRSSLFYFLLSLYLIFYIIKFKPHLIYERECLSFLPFIFAKLFNKPYFIEINGWIKDEFKATYNVKFNFYTSFSQKIKYKMSDGLIPLSLGLKEKLIELTKVKENKILAIHNGVNPNEFPLHSKEHSSKILNFDSSFLYVGFMGSFQKWQCLDLLVKSFAKVTQEKENVRLILVGTGRMLPELRTLARRLGIIDKVIFTGQVPHKKIPLYLGLFDVVVSLVKPWRCDSPVKVWEYMVCKKAVFTNYYPDIPNKKDVFQNALLVADKTLSQDEIKKNIILLLDDDDLRKKLGENARELVLKEFTWEKVARKTLNFIREIIME
jgi:glycosyltransferase involved in cell wall biosynthesis